eukprot:gene5146-1712_t
MQMEPRHRRLAATVTAARTLQERQVRGEDVDDAVGRFVDGAKAARRAAARASCAAAAAVAVLGVLATERGQCAEPGVAAAPAGAAPEGGDECDGC